MHCPAGRTLAHFSLPCFTFTASYFVLCSSFLRSTTFVYNVCVDFIFSGIHIVYKPRYALSATAKSTACNYLARLRVATGCGLIDLYAYRQYGQPLCLQHRSHPLFVPHSSHAPTSSSTRWRLACTTSAIHYAALHSLHPFFLALAQGCFTCYTHNPQLRIK